MTLTPMYIHTGNNFIMFIILGMNVIDNKLEKMEIDVNGKKF